MARKHDPKRRTPEHLPEKKGREGTPSTSGNKVHQKGGKPAPTRHKPLQAERLPQQNLDKQRLETILEAANVGTWEWNISTGEVLWSSNMEQLHGQASGSFGGTFEGFLRGVHPEDRGRVMRTIEESLAAGTPYQVAYRQATADGSVKWMEGKGRVIFDASRKPVRMLGVCSDATERKRRIELLKFQSDVLSQVKDVVLATDEDIRVTYWNKGAEQLGGYKAEEVLGRKLLDVVRFRWMHPEDEAACGKALAATGSWRGEVIWFEKDGEEVCVEATVSKVKGTLSTGDSYLALLRDITERKRAEEILRQSHEELEARVRARTAELQAAIEALQAEAEDHKRTGRALKESERRLQMLMDSSPAIIFMKDVQGCYLYVNPEFQKLCNLPQKDIIGKTDYDLFPIEQAEAFRGNDLLVLQTGLPLEFEERAVHTDGVHVSLVNKFPVRDTKSRVYAICGIVTDITQRKLSEEALRESEARMRALIASMDDIVFEIDEQGTYLYVWTAHERLLARPKRELIGQRLDAIFGAEFAAQFLQAFKRVLATGRPETIEYALDLPNGRRWFSGKMSPIHAEDGRGKRLCLLVREITNQKQAAVALQESEERFRLLLEGVKDYAVLMLSPEGQILSWNVGAERIYGYLHNEIVGKHFSIFYLDEEIRAGKPDRALRTAAEEGRFEEEGWRVRKDGSKYLANVVITALRDETGNLRGLSKVTRDVTERKLAEDSLRHLSGLLLQSQDEERRRLARELHDSVGQTLAVLALSLSSLMDLPEIANHPAAAKYTSDSMDWASRACSEIRTFSYLLHPPLLEVAGLGHALRWYVEGFAERTKIKVDLQVDPGLGRLSRDKELALYRIVQESLTNIHRHSKSPTAAIRLYGDDCRVTLEVRDHGKGMTLSFGEKPSGTPPHFGVGIRGMQERIRQLGGQIEFGPAYPGTRVRAILPLEDQEASVGNPEGPGV